MKKIFISLFLVLICLVFLLTCKKEEKTLPPIVPLSKVFKDWAYYKKGSWWVYEDSATKKLDSSIVTSDTIFISESRDGRKNDIVARVETFKYITYYFYSNTHYEYIGNSGCQDSFYNKQVCYNLMQYLKDTNNNILGRSVIFWLDTIINSIVDYSQLVKIYNSFVIENIEFKNVVKMHLPNDPTEQSREVYYYLSKHIGIIRKELNLKTNKQDPDKWQIWNLKKYNIIQ